MLELTSSHLDDFTLLRYVAEDLDDGERSQTEGHLVSCGVCKETIQELEELDRELKALAENPKTRRDFELEDLPEDDLFRRRPSIASVPHRSNADPPELVAASEEGGALSTVMLDAVKASAEELDSVLGRFEPDDPAHRFGLLYALQGCGPRVAEAPQRTLRFAELALGRVATSVGSGHRGSAEGILPATILLAQANQLAGQACLWTGELDRAKTHFELAYRGFGASSGSDVSLAYTEVLESQRRLFGGNPSQALVLASRAATTFQKLGLTESVARAQQAEAYALTRLGHHEEALEKCREVSIVFRDSELWSNYVAAVNASATILVRMGRLNEARREYAMALRRLSGSEHRSQLALIRQGLGEVLLSSGRYREAATSLARAARLFSECGMIAYSLMTSLQEMESWARAGEPTRALHRLRLFRTEVDRHKVLDASITRRIEEALSGVQPDFEMLSQVCNEARESLNSRLGRASA